MNTLGHGIFYSKVLQIETAIASIKLSMSITLLPNEIHQHILTSVVFENTDRLEETLSRSGITHYINEILIQQASLVL